jgi:hypothetical protein
VDIGIEEEPIELPLPIVPQETPVEAEPAPVEPAKVPA